MRQRGRWAGVAAVLAAGWLVSPAAVPLYDPQVTVYAPPQAFGVPAAAKPADIVLRAAPVALTPPGPPGTVASNVYALTLTSPDGPVTVRPEAQPPSITLRAVTAELPLPVVQYRASPDQPWRALETRQVGREVFNTRAPGPGEYVLSRPAAAKRTEGGRGLLPLVIGLAVLLVVGVLLAVRLLARQRE
ncbi:MAG: hypothetical protein LC789_07725 [Actinobacteria bacterium]|nr:hypothetical protein [Actinomycetota bacterium]